MNIQTADAPRTGLVGRRKQKMRPGLKEEMLSYRDIAHRWGCHEKTAMRLLKQAGVPIVHFTKTSVRVRLSDLLRFEQEATVCTETVASLPPDGTPAQEEATIT
jgi:hypothetical protein